MKSKTLRNIKIVSFLALLLIAFFMSFSCDNLFSDVPTSQTTPNETVAPSSEGSRTITVTGKINNPYETRSAGRSAMPSYDYSDKQYVVTAKADNDPDSEVDGTVRNDKFSIPLTLGKTWKITVELQKKETGDTDYVTVMDGSYTFTEPLSEITAGITIEIKPKTIGTGNIELSFTAVGDTVLYDSVRAEPVSTEQKTEWNAHVTTGTNGIRGTGIKSGVYSVTISFYLSNVLVYATMQEITVYDNMTTNLWDGSGSNSPINSDGTFKVTADLTERFKLTNYFVKSDGNNGNSGSPYSPLASINEALRRINVTGESDKNYTIWLMSDITEFVDISSSYIANNKASSITIQPMRNPVTIKGVARAFDISVSIPITLENLTLAGSTPSGGEGGAIHIDSNADVTISNCTITNNTIRQGDGGAIFNEGTLNVKGKVIISGNTKGSDSDSVASDIFLSEGKKINVVGTLHPDSRIGVITGQKPSYGSPRVITSGFTANSGLDSSLISTIFTCDEGYAVVASGSGTNVEAALEASGGSISNAFDYAVTLSCEDENIVPSSIITVTAAVTKGGNTVIPAADDISWSFDLLCGGDSVATLQGVSLVGYGAVTIPSDLKIFDGVTYTLHAKAVVNGVAYDEDFALIGNSDTLSAQGFVAVTGATVSGLVDQSQVFTTESSFTIPNLYVCDHEVTQAEFTAVMGFNTSSHDGSSGNQTAEGEKQKNRPVDCVNWYTALVYCNKRSRSEGLTPCYTINNSTNPDEWGVIPTEGYNATWDAVTCDFNANGYRLPKIEEWEYVARGGNGLTGTQYKYSGSDTPSDVAWYGTDEAHGGITHEVKKKEPNSLGIYDMSGNVWEWCWDANGNSRYARGGNFWRSAAHSELNYKGFSDLPFNGGTGDGFRVVRTMQ
ncbi:MAG: SUMF1/EgtB/PvdO family nonheme iron enzyme [Spirochaetaceae bacterium]|nr:SUMF1/EgtB/PvdO family nonheme iron enzyme [Spirochaetaceae bacterium]